MDELKANDPGLKSWVIVDENSDFPIQNLPFGIFKYGGKKARVGVAIGDFVLDLSILNKAGYFKSIGLEDPGFFRKRYLNTFIGKGRPFITKVRNRISELLESGNGELRDNTSLRSRVLIPKSSVEMNMPFRVGDYTDFYSSIEHATNVGSMFRDPENALLPNWKHLPVGYHGRASSIRTTGAEVVRPKGQTKLPSDSSPGFGPSRKLDFELEMAFVTCKPNELSSSISVNEAEDHIAGFVLFNDWSARDIQAWEYVPLGPFLGKNFISTISPWMVTMDALEPFRTDGPDQDPPVLDYLQKNSNSNFDINLQVDIIDPDESRTTVCTSNFKYMYWSVGQQLAHHTVNGCNINVGDLYASGTISGPNKESFGSMLELSWNGKEPVILANGSQRSFIDDGDTVVITGWCEKDGVRVGFGELSNKVLPAK